MTCDRGIRGAVDNKCGKTRFLGTHAAVQITLEIEATNSRYPAMRASQVSGYGGCEIVATQTQDAVGHRHPTEQWRAALNDAYQAMLPFQARLAQCDAGGSAS